jgi:hypothetical protein
VTKQQATVPRPVSTTADRRARAQQRSHENFLLAERQIRSKAFVYKSTGGRSRPPGQVESWDDAIPDLVRCPRDGPHPRRGDARRGQGLARGGPRGHQRRRVGFGRGLENQKASIVATDGTVTDGPYPEAIGGLYVVEVPSHKEALEWAAKTASACRCAVEVWEFMPDPETDEMLRQADSRR